MKKIISLLLVLVLSLSLFACKSDDATAEPAPAAETKEAGETASGPAETDYLKIDTLEVQLIPSRDAEVLDAQRAPLQEALSEKLGMPVNVTIATQYTALIEAMKSEKVHVGFLAPASYALAADQGAAEVIVVSTRYDVDDEGNRLTDQPLVTSYRAQLLAGKDSGISQATIVLNLYSVYELDEPVLE